MYRMKKFLMIAFMALMSTTMFAQQGSTWVGANVNYGLDSDYKNLGFGANVGAGIEYPITDGIKLNLEGKYQIVKDWDRPVISAGVSFAL